nr:MAG TPA: hypothetical protein [Caudoviricetes sp.]
MTHLKWVVAVPFFIFWKNQEYLRLIICAFL